MLGLLSLPYEVLANIVNHISFDDVFALGQTCKDFLFLLNEEGIGKLVVQTKIKFSNEAILARRKEGGNSRALRRAAKRRLALANAYPFAVATIGFCDAYIYNKGVLCYTLDDRIRILDLHRSGHHELVISVPGLLTQALTQIGDNNKGVFQILHYSDGIVSCLYKSCCSELTAWLISFHLRTRTILVVHELESTDKIFVRHNKFFLYYGTHSELGADGYKKWVVHGYEFAQRKWFPEKVHFPDLVGSEIGSNICFELYNGSFYALSNQTSFEVEEIDWTSFYHCMRFPLNSPSKELLEKTENTSMWRRQHQEGPIDDRWTNLRLFEDESTGALRIIEARKEWYLGSSKSQRTYYTTDIIFPERSENVEMAYSRMDSSPMAISIGIGSSSNDGASSIPNIVSDSSSSSARASSSRTANTSYISDDNDANPANYPDPQLARLIDAKEDHPHFMDPFARRPEDTHPGNDGSTQPTHTLAKSRIRTYFTDCSTFMDLVDDPLPSDWTGTQRLRLRAGTRNLGPPLRGEDELLLRSPPDDVDIALQKMYKVPSIAYWPPAQDPKHPNSEIDMIYRLMNPPSHLGNVEGTADERSLVYVTGGCGQPRALIFVGFDPAIKLAGLKKWGLKGVGEGPHVDGRATGCTDLEGGEGYAYIDVDEADRTVVVDRKGKGKEKAIGGGAMVQVTGGEAMVDIYDDARRGNGKWAWKEPAMYQDINLGFYFGKDPKGKETVYE